MYYLKGAQIVGTTRIGYFRTYQILYSSAIIYNKTIYYQLNSVQISYGISVNAINLSGPFGSWISVYVQSTSIFIISLISIFNL